MIEQSTRRLIYGGLVHATSLTELQELPRALLAIDADGKIAWLEEDVESSLVQQVAQSKGWTLGEQDLDFVELPPGEWILPGFVDTHTHAPQYPNMGAGQQYELLDWLANVTFPTEAKFANLDYARRTYTSVVQRVLDCGTTTCCYYGSLHLEATKVLADICHTKGQRAFVGKCNMDRNAAPTYQEPSAEQSLEETEAFIKHVASIPENDLVEPILTPRFAIACSSQLLQGLGGIAERNPTMAIQTHISENASEIAFTSSLFPEAPHYAGVYDSFGLLRRKTILAHACHLDDNELTIIKQREAGISHCPTSNFNLRSGMAKVGEMLDRGIKVGLGTDVSGGFSPSILRTIQDASICSKMIAIYNPPTPESRFASRQLPIPTLLYLATMGGADLCGLQSTVGNFVPGKEFDALLVDMKAPGVPNVWYEDGMSLDCMLEKFLFCGDSRNIAAVWVKNRVVAGTRLR